SRGPGLTASGAGGTFSSSAWTLTAAVDPTDYYTITVTPAAGFTVSLLGIALDEKRSATGIQNWVVRSSLDGFTANLSAFTIPLTDTNFHNNQVPPLGAAFRGLSAPVEFRIYGFLATANAGTWRLDNIKFNGFTTGP